MPESAEVKLTAEYLHMCLVDKEITDWVFFNETGPNGLADSLPAMVESVQCKGKLVYFTLYTKDTRFFVLHHLMMTGSWHPTGDGKCRWRVTVDDSTNLWFKNPRKFATIKMVDEKELDRSLSALGPDILTEDFTLVKWNVARLKYKNRNITAFLMDQSIFCGCGNYIKAEALYYAKISPLRKVKSLNDTESEMLFNGLRLIPRSVYGIAKDYSSVYVDKNSILKIYGKNGAEKIKTPDGRMTYWDPKVQK